MQNNRMDLFLIKYVILINIILIHKGVLDMSKDRIKYKKIISTCIIILFFVSLVIFYILEDLTFSERVELLKYATLIIVAGPAIIARHYYW